MFANARAQFIICTSQMAAVEPSADPSVLRRYRGGNISRLNKFNQLRSAPWQVFYRDILGLPLQVGSDGALVFDTGSSDLRIAPVPDTQPSAHTVLGFSVPNIDSVIASLGARGVEFERFEHFPHEDNGALTSPDGSRVAWFRDPDGNLLSIVQYGA